jgi:S1-C subfamily serine protease
MKKLIPFLIVHLVCALCNPQQAAATTPDPTTEIVRIYAHVTTDDSILQGTGWFINNHTLITDYHVIRNCDKIAVVWSDKKWSPAKILNAQPRLDLVALDVLEPRADQEFIEVIPDSDTVQCGQRVTAYGYPNNDWRVSYGTVSHRYSQNGGEHVAVWGSNDLALDHGGSGSPVCDDAGLVVGIAKSISKPGLPYECFIITVNVIWEALGLTNKNHPNGFTTGVTDGLDLDFSQAS